MVSAFCENDNSLFPGRGRCNLMKIIFNTHTSLGIGDEDDGYDETLIPVDFQKAGQIRDDDLLKILVHPMREGVTMTCLMDCCHR